MSNRTKVSFVQQADGDGDIVIRRQTKDGASQVVACRFRAGHDDPDWLQQRSRQLIDLSRLVFGGTGALEVSEH